jgi:hypothetical protein
MRNVPGRKTDLKDCQWIAELHEHGLLRSSFIPAAEVAALRQRARYPRLCRHRHRVRYAEARMMPMSGRAAWLPAGYAQRRSPGISSGP